jgi:aquaporin related protein
MAINLLPLHKKDENAENADKPRRANGHIPNGRHHHHGHGTSEAQKKAAKLGIPNKWRNELVAAAAEFAGTFMFLFFVRDTLIHSRYVLDIETLYLPPLA